MGRASAATEHLAMLDLDARTTTVRPAAEHDAEAIGRIFFDAFAAIAARHGFPPEPGSPEFTRFKTAAMLADPGVHALAAERDGEVVGAIFVDERSTIAGVGPVVVDPDAQDAGAGRRLMEAVTAREAQRGVAGVRLVQTGYHSRSLALYAKLGFRVREPLSVIQGTPPRGAAPAGTAVRRAAVADVEAAGALCRRVHGHERSAELREGVAAGTALVVERDGRLTGYATGLGYGWHAVGEADADVQALLSAPDAYLGLGVLVPSRNAALLGWALDHGLRIVQQAHLMTTGLYSEPSGAWLPSIVY
jgi:predicted N-acetyltransferase YhbS